MSRRALVVWGGWSGHAPEEMADAAAGWLKAEDFEVTVTNDVAAYVELATNNVDLVVQAITAGTLTAEQEAALLAVVRGGTGIAGWHGGLCDSFRANPNYQFLTGGQWVAHPGGSQFDYQVDVVADHPIVDGISNFSLTGEQYYLHVDPAIDVLATTTFPGTPDEPWTEGVVMPAVWTRSWGAGRVFYASFAHWPAELEVPEVSLILRRGLLWASR